MTDPRPHRFRYLPAAVFLLFALTSAALLAASLVPPESLPMPGGSGAPSGGRMSIDASELGLSWRRLQILKKLRWLSALSGVLAAVSLHPVIRALEVKAWAVLKQAARPAIRSTAASLATTKATHWAALAGITAVGAGMRASFLGRPLLWDEATTFFDYVMQPWWIAPTWYPAPNNHVFHSELAWLSTTLLSPEAWALRVPAFVAGTLLIPAVWLLARRLYDDRVALLAAAMVAASSVLVGTSVEARGYSIVALCFTIILWLAVDLRTRDNAAVWLVFAAVSALGAYAIPTMVFPYAFVCVWLMLCALVRRHVLPPRALLGRLVVVGGAVGAFAAVLYMPILVVSGYQAIFSNWAVQPLLLSDLIGAIWHEGITAFGYWAHSLPGPAQAIVAVSLVLGLALHWRHTTYRVPILVGLLGPILLMLAQRIALPARAWTFLLPIVVITVASGVVWTLDLLVRNRRANRYVTMVLGIGLVAVIAVGTMRTEFLVSWDLETETMLNGPAVADFLATELGERDAVLTAFPSTRVLRYELRRRGLDHHLTRPPENPRTWFVVVNSYRYPQTLQDVQLRNAPVTKGTPPRGATRVFAEGFVEIYRVANAGG